MHWMLREHPRLAIPPETPWLVDLAPRRGRWSRSRQVRVLEAILRHPRYGDWALSEAAAREAVARRAPPTYAELVAALLDAYAELMGKPRWGNKTPENVLQIGFLSRLFPRSVFIHVIRDGRDVAASLSNQGWASDRIVGNAYWWRDCVSAGRGAGRRLGPARYREIRLEDLIAEPENALQRICEGIGETYMPQMLEYTHRAAELEAWEPRPRRSHQHLAKPPTAGLRDWKAGVSAEQQNAVNHICRPLLRELGYER